MSWADGNNIGVILYLDRLKACYTAGEETIRDDIYFDGVDNNYGGAQRFYFLCPFCGRRCRRLYMHRLHFKCRLCAQLNYYSQQVSKGAYAAQHRLDSFLKDKFKMEKTLAPIEAEVIVPKRPKGMHFNTYIRLLHELRELQDQYYHDWTAGILRVMGPNFRF